MSLFGKLLGRRSFDDKRQAADEAFDRGQWGDAKLLYERARSNLPEGFEAVGVEIDGRLVECRDGIARGHIAEGKRLLVEGHLEFAMDELRMAAEHAASDSLKREAEQAMEQGEQDDARSQAFEGEQSEEDRLEAISASWEEKQLQEYERHGEDLLRAVLAVYSGEGPAVRPALESMTEAAQEPSYLWLELARARLQDDDSEGGRDALERFVATLGEREGGEARLVAHMELAALHREADRIEDAVGQYQAALEAMPEDPRPYLAMGAFFRSQQLAEEAADVLEAGVDVMGEARPEWRMLQELGLAHADLGHDEQAIALLEQVIDFLISHQHLDLPPEATTRLASLYEANDRATRALDLYTMLAAGSDVANHFAYHVDAGRLMIDLGLTEDARRMLTRAGALAPQDAEERAPLDAALARLGDP